MQTGVHAQHSAQRARGRSTCLRRLPARATNLLQSVRCHKPGPWKITWTCTRPQPLLCLSSPVCHALQAGLQFGWEKTPNSKKAWISAIVGSGTALIAAFIGVPIIKKKVEADLAAEAAAAEQQ